MPVVADLGITADSGTVADGHVSSEEDTKVSEETLQGGCSTVVQATGVMDRYGWLLLLFWLAGAARARSALRVVARSEAPRSGAPRRASHLRKPRPVVRSERDEPLEARGVQA